MRPTDIPPNGCQLVANGHRGYSALEVLAEHPSDAAQFYLARSERFELPTLRFEV